MIVAAAIATQTVGGAMLAAQAQWDDFTYSRCIPAMETGKAFETDDLAFTKDDPLPKDFWTNSETYLWAHKDAAFALQKIAKNGFVGCAVDSGLAPTKHNVGLPGNLSADKAISDFDRWANEGVRSGEYRDVPLCEESDADYLRVVRGRLDHAKHIKVFLQYTAEIDHLFFVAAEVPASQVEC